MIETFIAAAAGLAAGFLASRSLRGEDRYETPYLHEGRWGRPVINGANGQTRITWDLIAGHPICVGGNHHPVKCTIGPGMAHVDKCVCGAERYGVFGAWS